jgi:erythromycin esterase-like protein
VVVLGEQNHGREGRKEVKARVNQATGISGNWKVVVLGEQNHGREGRKEVKARVNQAIRELRDLLSQA